MSYIDDVGQKIKGKVQQAEGDFNQMRGKNVKGGIQKIKGKLNETAADIKIKVRQ
jgi:uncharacterized protein YjbJ (UPF0337 family)